MSLPAVGSLRLPELDGSTAGLSIQKESGAGVDGSKQDVHHDGYHLAASSSAMPMLRPAPLLNHIEYLI